MPVEAALDNSREAAMPNRPVSAAQWCALSPPDCDGLLRNHAAPCPRLEECPRAERLAGEESLEQRRLQHGQPLLLRYPTEFGEREVFGEVTALLIKHNLVRLYREDGSVDAILIEEDGRGWLDATNRVRVKVVEELSGPQLSRFMLCRDYAHSGCATSRQPCLKGLRASA
jgi:hypothetical protein